MRPLWVVAAVAVVVAAVVGMRAVARRRARAVGPVPVPRPSEFSPDDPAFPPDDAATPAWGIPVVAGSVVARNGTDDQATDPGLRVPVAAGWLRTGPGATLVAPQRRPAPMPGGAGPWTAGPSHPPVPQAVVPPHRWGLGAYLLAEAVFLGVSVLIGATLVGEGTVSTDVLAVAIGVPSVVAAAAAIVITIVRGNGPFVDLRLYWSWRQVGVGLAFGFGGLFVSLPASAVYVSVVGEDASSAVGDVFGGVTATPAVALGIAVLVVLVVPLCEEILYRGLLWGGITRLGANAWVAFGVTTVIFALAHFEWPRAILLLVVALPIGLARIYGDGLLAPIIAHQANNLLPGVGLYLMLTGAFPAI